MFLFGFLRKNNKHFFSVSPTQNCFSPLERPEVKLLKSFVRILALNVFFPKLAFSHNVHISSSGCGGRWNRGPPPAGQDEAPLSHLIRCHICGIACEFVLVCVCV